MASREDSLSSSLTKKRGRSVAPLPVCLGFNNGNLARHRGFQHHRMYCSCTFQRLGCYKNHREEGLVRISMLLWGQNTRRCMHYYCILPVIVLCFIVSTENLSKLHRRLTQGDRKNEVRTLMTKYMGQIKVWCTSTSDRYTKSMWNAP